MEDYFQFYSKLQSPVEILCNSLGYPTDIVASALIYYLYREEKPLFSEIDISGSDKSDLWNILETKLSQKKEEKKELLPEQPENEKKEIQDLSLPQKKNVLFYAQNKDEAAYLTSIIDELNRSATLLCDFSGIPKIFSSYMQVIQLNSGNQKREGDAFINKIFQELYHYENVFNEFLDKYEPAGIVLLGNTSFQEKILGNLGRTKQIPVIALANNDEDLNPLDILPYDHYISLDMTDTSGDFRKNVAGQIAKQINEYVPHPYLAETQEPKLHVGCGTRPMDGWLNIDLSPFSEKVYYMNAEKKFPFPDSSFEYVFSEHLFEHLNYEGGKNMLHECHRVLKPRGIIRLAMPGLEFLIDLYVNKDKLLNQKYIDWSVTSYGGNIKRDFGTEKIPAMFVVNNFMHFFGHQMLYDRETIGILLQKTGFKNITYPKIGESIYPVLRNAEQHGKVIPEWTNNLETFVVEAEKKLILKK